MDFQLTGRVVKDSFRRRLYLVAVGLGVAWASFQAFESGPQRGDETVVASLAPRPPPAEGIVAVSRHSTAVDDDAVAAPMAEVVFAAQGVALEPLRHDGEFLGYLVRRSHDPRLSVGVVISAIDGAPVEDSAAGGEFLAAALRRPEVELELQEWRSLP